MGVFKISRVHSDGSLSCFGFFGQLEMESFMCESYGICGTILVERNDGKCVQYGDNGSDWEVMRKWSK